jgi:hypothetical protein
MREARGDLARLDHVARDDHGDAGIATLQQLLDFLADRDLHARRVKGFIHLERRLTQRNSVQLQPHRTAARRILGPRATRVISADRARRQGGISVPDQQFEGERNPSLEDRSRALALLAEIDRILADDVAPTAAPMRAGGFEPPTAVTRTVIRSNVIGYLFGDE